MPQSVAKKNTRKKRFTKVAESEEVMDLSTLLDEPEAQSEVNTPTTEPQVVENTRPLEPAEPKRRTSLFHRNGKKPKVLRFRSLLFTDKPYGFREAWVEESTIMAAGITPVKDDKGDVYLVVKRLNDAGEAVYSRWPGGIEFPEVPSGKLGRARTWDMISIIARSGRKGMGALNVPPWLIVVAVLILIFFIGFFGLFGGN